MRVAITFKTGVYNMRSSLEIDDVTSLRWISAMRFAINDRAEITLPGVVKSVQRLTTDGRWVPMTVCETTRYYQ